MFKTYPREIFVLSLAVLFLLNSAGCMKRVPVQLDGTQAVEKDDLIYVTLRSGTHYKVKDPKFEELYLIGMISDNEVKIPLEDIQSIEVVRPDKKRFVIVYLISIIVLLAIAKLVGPPIGYLGD